MARATSSFPVPDSPRIVTGTSLSATRSMTRKTSRIPAERLLVTESGILGADDVRRMREAGVHAFLVGEAFMRAPDPGAALATLFGA